MSNNLAAKLAALRTQMTELTAAMSTLERFATEPPLGTVIRWFHRFKHNPKVYDYVAVRSGNGWHTTGRDSTARPWSAIREMIADQPCWIVNTWDEIPQLDPQDDEADAEQEFIDRCVANGLVPDTEEGRARGAGLFEAMYGPSDRHRYTGSVEHYHNAND